MMPDRWRLALLAALVGSSQAQSNQINNSICNWGQLRANIIRDTVYMDGGELAKELGYSTGEVQWRNNQNPDSITYYLNLSSTFNTQTDNFTELFGELQKTAGRSNLAPNYNDGVMFANDGKFFLYGGYLTPTESADYPPSNTIIAYEAYQWGPYISTFEPGIQSTSLTDGVTWYITNGAGVSSPSENLGFYISGVHAPGWGPTLSDDNLRNLSQQIITLDMSDMNKPKFSNVSIPSHVPPRANAEAVWLPVGDRGIIVLIGGVTHPEQLYSVGMSTDEEEDSQRDSPAFMQTVSIYDIAGDNWYIQNTTGDVPPQLESFCSVYASAPDGSSQNIYIYGGYAGVSPKNMTSDDTYVLSLPSFEWIKLYDGDSDNDGRKQHKCVKPYPDKMLVLGGRHYSDRDCVDPVRVFNLNTGRFQDTYDPEDWEEYKVPDLVSGRIGGNTDGGATKTAPDSWNNSTLGDLFGTEYSKTIETYYPYHSSSTPTTTSVPSGGGGFPGWAGAVIGVVLGVLALAGIIAFFLIRRRRKRGTRRQSEVSGITARVTNWMNAGAFAPPGSKDPEDSTTVTGDMTNDGSTVIGQDPSLSAPPASQATQEVAGDPVYEVHGHSSAAARQAAHAVELPTSYNQDTLNPVSPTATVPVGYTSPVSPEPQEKEGDEPSRPGHQRNVSSLSSVPSYDPALGDESDSVAQRPRYVSGMSEASVSSAGTRADGTGTAFSNRGLGLEDIPDEDHRER